MTQVYVGTKIVTAWEQLGGPKVRVCGRDCKEGTENCNGYCTGKADHPAMLEQVPGYAVKYPDGYVSWCPKDVFELSYLPMGQTGHLQPHEERVVAELVELDNRLVKLKAFVELNKTNAAFPAYEMSLLRAQIPAMEKLASILEERVARF